eukprot:TRINITY_DN3520_c0_g1_i1.p1 TRINITY_DN3520_c0_g1~~TRINITY_DN3520_c0_g1_i1.p1  ORF type:complete len:457 (-),score=36.29 TRINITY_DN3520_c0_g1_i1:281-1489(-)
MKLKLQEKLKSQGVDRQIVGISELNGGEECFVVGTIYKAMKLRPTIMDEYTEQENKDIQSRQFFGQDSDDIFLEDESARMKVIIQGYSSLDFLTGQVIGLQGSLSEDRSYFQGTQVVWAGPAPQKSLQDVDIDSDRFVVLLSGLGLGRRNSQPLCLDMFFDYIKGALGGASDIEQISSKIVRVVIVGNSISNVDYLAAAPPNSYEQNVSTECILDLDRYLTEILGYVPVDLMPGPSDPINLDFPQQPLHRCLLPVASTYNSFSSVTNPYTFSQDGVNFLGSSGQNLEDVLRYADFSSFKKSQGDTEQGLACDALLRCGHLAPTAPDTLGCHLFVNKDPFILHESPHVFFVGNQAKYHTRVFSEEGVSVRVVCVPSFCETQQAVLINLRNLECFPISVGDSIC